MQMQQFCMGGYSKDVEVPQRITSQLIFRWSALWSRDICTKNHFRPLWDPIRDAPQTLEGEYLLPTPYFSVFNLSFLAPYSLPCFLLFPGTPLHVSNAWYVGWQTVCPATATTTVTELGCHNATHDLDSRNILMPKMPRDIIACASLYA